MADSKTTKLNPRILQADLDTYTALKAFPDYKPANNDYTVAKGENKKGDKDTKQELEVQKKADWQAARDDAVAAEWAFHDWILGARDQVKAQYGPNSNQYQSIGLKKKSEYKSKTSKKPKTP